MGPGFFTRIVDYYFAASTSLIALSAAVAEALSPIFVR